MYLMRIGPSGSERPVVRIDDTHYVDVADVINDFDEEYFGSGGLSGLRDIVIPCRASSEKLRLSPTATEPSVAASPVSAIPMVLKRRTWVIRMRPR